MQYFTGILTLSCVNLLAVLGVSLLTGFTGIFTFGHAAYMAIGAYTSALLTVRFHVPFEISLIGVVAVCGLAGYLVGLPTLRLVGDYFAIAALGFGEAIRLILDNGGKVTGGARGFAGIPAKTTWYVALLVASLGILCMRNIILSRFGRAFLAIREDRLAAEACGIPTFKFKCLALVISCIYAGVAGALFGHYLGYIQPIMFDMAKSTEIASAVVFGGLGSLTGSILASIILTVLPEIFRPLYQWRLVMYGIALVGTIVLRPSGLMGGQELSKDGLRKVLSKKGARTEAV